MDEKMTREARVAEIRRLLRESRSMSLVEEDPDSRTMGLADSAIAQSEELLAGVRALARLPRRPATGEDVGVSVNTTAAVDGDGSVVDESGSFQAGRGGDALKIEKERSGGTDTAQIWQECEKQGDVDPP